ncbi:MAG: protein kinase [Roseiflexus sp.]|nr:protein kinase [Roseiflexus sp.]MCS7289130.1 protein kinase [Roseiflexus sp.]MDW8145254.1 protein kinase [Roseiflexaceae bacterium]MDW8233146.1 protein kinase [Roseiflexaceae bacterium]
MLAPDTLVHNRYRIVRTIGKGGMGAVYEAFDLRLQSPVALKQMIVEGEQLSRAFAHEARLLASLRHQALPRVIDYFVDDQGQFLVMEFIPGDDLATLLQKRGAPFLVDQVLSWADMLLDALSYLHSQQPPVVHRDIKPQNMKLTPRGEVILLDFGLAKGATTAQTRSMIGSVFGYTPQYAPLEQIKGSGTEPRSDIYALRATLYNLMTGAPPPDALTRAAATIAHEPDPLKPAHQLNPAVPEEISAILSQALALDPAARFASAEAMRRALRTVRGLSEPLPAVDPNIAVGRRTTAVDPRPASPSSVRQATMPAGAIRDDARLPALSSPSTAPAQRRGLRVSGTLGVITLAIAIVAIIGVVYVVRQIGPGIQQGIGQAMEQVTSVTPTVVAAQQTPGAISTQTAAVKEQATALAPTREASQRTIVAATTTVVEEAPLLPGEGRPNTVVPYRLNEVISGELPSPDVRVGYEFVIDTPQQIVIETRKYARGMEQVNVMLIGPAGGQLLNTCLGCGHPGLQSLSRPGKYMLVLSGAPNAGTGAFEMQTCAAAAALCDNA